MPHSFLTVLFLFTFVFIALYFDARYHRIPNGLNVTGMLAGFTLQAVNEDTKKAIFGFLIGFISSFMLYVFQAIGAGDVKCFAAIGALTSWIFALEALIFSVCFAGLIALILRFLMRSKRTHFPFMYAVTPAVILVDFYARQSI